jgi:predicted Zn-dependent peptidase
LILGMTTDLFWRREVLANGLRVLSLPRQSANTTQLSVAVEYGSNQEPEENAGVAHFIEHMIAGGSTKRIELSRSIENSGGILDFYTDHEHTMSTMDILPEELHKGSLVISELLFDSHFEEEKFLQERKIILNELAEVEDDPVEKMEQLLLKSLFKTHPVNRPVLGSSKTIKHLTLEQLGKTQQENYVPQNMILILSGKFSQTTSEAVLKNFENKTAKKTLSRKPCLAETSKPQSTVVKKKPGISQAYLSIGSRTVSSSHKDGPTLDLISTILGGSTSSRLFIEIREKNGLTYDINAAHKQGLDFGFFSISCAVKDQNSLKTKNLILKELSKLKTEKIPLDELEKNKKIITAGILREMDNPQEAPGILAYLEMQFGSEKSLVDYIGKVKSVSSQDIIDAANSYLQNDCVSTVLLNPQK